MIAATINVKQVINLMYNKHNMMDAVAKGISYSYTYHSLACSAMMRYLRLEVATYANMGEDTFRLSDDSLMVKAIMWTLFPPTNAEQRGRNLRGDESATKIASGMYTMFTDVVLVGINLGMHNCLGIHVRPPAICPPPPPLPLLANYARARTRRGIHQQRV